MPHYALAVNVDLCTGCISCEVSCKQENNVNLGISKNTVRTHLRSVYTKLGVHSRQELLNFIGGDDAAAQ